MIDDNNDTTMPGTEGTEGGDDTSMPAGGNDGTTETGGEEGAA